ncbi:MAG TPA: OsmC family protein [Prochlorococcus sp.]
MTRIHCSYIGNLRCEASHVPSGEGLTTDAPIDHEGKGEAFSPTDLIATALGTCVLTVMGITARQRGWEIDGASVDVEKIMTSKGPRSIETLKLLITMPPEISKQQLQLLQRMVDTCPVKRNLEGSITMKFIWI